MRESISMNSMLYDILWKTGGDKLVAVYAKIKQVRGIDEMIYGTAKLKFYGLLHKKTGISRKTLKRYVPQLESLGIISFSKKGHVWLMGSNKIRATFKTKSKKYKDKRVRITIGKTLAETAFNSFKVRVHGLVNTLTIRAEKYNTQGNLKANTKPMFEPDDKAIDLDKPSCKKVQLSILGFGAIKTGQTNKFHSGNYWKNKLVRSGFIFTKRHSLEVKECSKAEYLSIKRLSGNGRLNYFAGKMWQEEASLVSLVPFI